MKVTIDHPHECECISKAPAMAEGRDWWIGKLTEPVKEYPIETHCLHLTTKTKSVVFLCNMADFQQMQVMCQAVTGKLDDSWMKTMLKLTK